MQISKKSCRFFSNINPVYVYIIFSFFFVEDIWILSIDYLPKHFCHEESSGLESSLEYSNRCRDAFYCPCKTRHPQLRDCDVSNGDRKAEIFNGTREKMEGGRNENLVWRF